MKNRRGSQCLSSGISAVVRKEFTLAEFIESAHRLCRLEQMSSKSTAKLFCVNPGLEGLEGIRCASKGHPSTSNTGACSRQAHKLQNHCDCGHIRLQILSNTHDHYWHNWHSSGASKTQHSTGLSLASRFGQKLMVLFRTPQTELKGVGWGRGWGWRWR